MAYVKVIRRKCAWCGRSIMPNSKSKYCSVKCKRQKLKMTPKQ